MITLAEYLTSHFDLTPNQLQEIIPAFSPARLKKNEFFLQAGNRCNQIAFIQSGVMRNYSINEQGDEVTNYMTSDGDFNTVYRYLISHEMCPENIQAVTDCDILVINRADFLHLRKHSDTFRTVVEKLVEEGLECKEERLRAYLNKDAQKRYENLITRQPKVVQFTPMQHIASYLGIARETLSRIRNRKLAEA